MFTIGLTGGICSGKTTVTDLFFQLGIHIIDADEISRELLSGSLFNSPSPALLQIKKLFGKDFFDDKGKLIRPKLKHRIFSSTKAKIYKKTLEDIIHPLVDQKIDQKIKFFDQQLNSTSHIPPSYLIVSIPLLLESSNNYHFDHIIVVDIDKPTQIQRCSQRDNLSTQQIDDIINAQASREQRLLIADDIIDNNLALDQLTVSVNNLHNKFLTLSKQLSKQARNV